MRVVFGGLAILVLSVARPAEACSFLGFELAHVPLLEPHAEVPADFVGLVETRLLTASDGTWVIHRVDTNTDIAVDIERSERFLRLVPAEELAVDVEYEARSYLGAAIDDASLVQTIPFHTTAALTDAPPVPTIRGVNVGQDEAQSTPCGELPARVVATFDLVDDPRVQGFRLRRTVDGHDAIDVDFVATSTSEATLREVSTTLSGAQHYEIVAIDFAGNESAAVSRDVDFGDGPPTGSCAAAPAPPLVAAALCALLSRRRRPRR